MKIETVSDFRKAMRHGQYAWPGGYQCYFITADGAAISFEAARSERRQIIDAIGHQQTWSGWRIVAMGINWEETGLTCEHTGKLIPAAYDAK